MKKFLAVFYGTTASKAKWDALDANTRKEREKKGMQAWGSWIEANHKSFKDIGAPLGKTKKVDAQGISDIRNELAAYTLVEAESHEAAAKLFVNHPHFAIFPGDSIEIMECMPIPTGG